MFLSFRFMLLLLLFVDFCLQSVKYIEGKCWIWEEQVIKQLALYNPYYSEFMYIYLKSSYIVPPW